MGSNLLGSRLVLHDVSDVEGLAGRVLEERCREWRSTLRPDLREEALSWLIAKAWELSEAYDPERGLAFSTYCYRTLRLRLVDWYRETFGDSRSAPRPIMLSLDRPMGDGEPLDFGSNVGMGRPTEWLEAIEASAANMGPSVEEEAFSSVSLGLEWADLSLEAQRARWEIGDRLAAGLSLEAIALELGESRRSVNKRLEALRAELLARRPDLPEWLR